MSFFSSPTQANETLQAAMTAETKSVRDRLLRESLEVTMATSSVDVTRTLETRIHIVTVP